MGKVWCRIRFAVRTQIRESGTKMSQFGLARPGFWILNECMVNTLKVTEIRRHFWIRNNIFQCKLKPEVDNRHLSLNSIFIDGNWRKRSRRFAISFWQNGGRFGYFILLQSIFFALRKKMLVEWDVVVILERKRKAPERSWTWAYAILERGSGVWVGRVEVQLAPSPEKQQQQQQQQHWTTSSSTTSTIKIKKTIKTLLCSSEEKFV